jgi:predicted regulator of Ras-like GTPase activity (Roadblock/LC7/MglB family)
VSSFAGILADVVHAVPGAVGAVFVDWEGEMVEQVPAGASGEELKLLGAHWAIAYYQTKTALDNQGLGAADEVLLRFEHQQILIRRVTNEYLVVLAVGRDTNLGHARYLLQLAGLRLRSEM